MDEQRLQEIEARHKAATPGEWEDRDIVLYDSAEGDGYEDGTFGTCDDVDFIINAHKDVPDLIAAVRERDARIADLEQQIVDGSDRARRAADEAAARIAELEAALPEPNRLRFFRDIFTSKQCELWAQEFDDMAAAIRKAQGE